MPSRLNESVCSVKLLNHFLNHIIRFSESRDLNPFYWIVQSNLWTKPMIQWVSDMILEQIRSFSWAVLSLFIESVNHFNKSVHSFKQFNYFLTKSLIHWVSGLKFYYWNNIELISKPNQLIPWANELNSDSWTDVSVQLSCSIQFTNQINQFIRQWTEL